MPHTVAGVAGGATKLPAPQERGETAAAIGRYLQGEELTVRDIYVIQSFLAQWADSIVWDQHPNAAKIRGQVHKARTLQQINDCMRMLVAEGMDPL